MTFHINDRDEAIKWARSILTKDFVVLDTETTGLEPHDVVISIGVIDKRSKVLLISYAKSPFRIPAAATAVHGITDEMIADAPHFYSVYVRLVKQIRNRPILIYNRDYDLRMIRQSLESQSDDWEQIEEAMAVLCKDMTETHCVMEWFAQFYGEWNDYHNSYTRKKLIQAARHFNISTEGAHGAIADCLMTLRVVEAMAKAKSSIEK